MKLCFAYKENPFGGWATMEHNNHNIVAIMICIKYQVK